MKLFPHHSELLIILGDKRSKSHGRAVWYGLTQGLVNFPRLFISSLFSGLKMIVSGVVCGLSAIFIVGLILPVMSSVVLVFLGLLGKITVTSDTETEAFKTAKIKMFGELK